MVVRTENVIQSTLPRGDHSLSGVYFQNRNTSNINSNWGNSIAFSLKKYVYECLTEYNVQPKATFQQAGLKRRSTSVRCFHSQCSLPDRPYTRLYPFMDTELSYTEYQELSRRYHHFLGRNGNFRRAGARIARTIPDSGCVPYGIALSPSEHKPRERR